MCFFRPLDQIFFEFQSHEVHLNKWKHRTRCGSMFDFRKHAWNVLESQQHILPKLVNIQTYLTKLHAFQTFPIRKEDMMPISTIRYQVLVLVNYCDLDGHPDSDLDLKYVEWTKDINSYNCCLLWIVNWTTTWQNQQNECASLGIRIVWSESSLCA